MTTYLGRAVYDFSPGRPQPAVPVTPTAPTMAQPQPSQSPAFQPVQPVSPPAQNFQPVQPSPVQPVSFAQNPITQRLMPDSVPSEVLSAPQEALAPAEPPIQYSPVEEAEPAPVAPTPGPASPFDLRAIEEIEKPKNRLTAGRAFRKWLLRGGLAALVLMVGIGGLLFAQGYMKVHRVFKGTAAHSAALQANVDVTKLKGEGDGRVNILLLGNGGGTHDAPDLTDTLMVMSIDPVNKKAVLLSVPRDLWVNVPSYNAMKINAVYEVGKYNYEHKIDSTNNNTQAVEAGFAMADKQVETVLGIPIHYNMLVNFAAFRQAIDTVGGVNISVPTQLYDPTMAWENHGNPVLAAAGPQQMSGTQALLYVRSRETSSDFARSQRQRAMLLALKDKVLSAGTLSNPLKISQLMSAFGNNMVTDFSLSDANRAYQIMKDISNTNVQSMDLVTPPNALVTTGNINGVSIDVPKAGQFNYTAIQNFVHSGLKDGFLVNENAQLTVLNGTAKEGLATTKANELRSYGYNVTSVGNAPTKTYAKTVIVDFSNGADKVTKQYLETRYGVKSVNAVPDPAIQRGSADFIVILGAEQQ